MIIDMVIYIFKRFPVVSCAWAAIDFFSVTDGGKSLSITVAWNDDAVKHNLSVFCRAQSDTKQQLRDLYISLRIPFL